MSVIIGGYKSLGKVDNYSLTPDDRQELVQLNDGVVAIDGWQGVRNTDGDVVSFTALFERGAGEEVIGLWNNRTLTTVTLEDGTTLSNARVIVRRITYPEALVYRSTYMYLELEIWKV